MDKEREIRLEQLEKVIGYLEDPSIEQDGKQIKSSYASARNYLRFEQHSALQKIEEREKYE